jgi:hypothetical protein
VPKMDIAKAMVRTKGVYPDPWRAITEGREKAALGDVVGLTQFGVNLTRLKSGAASALRHWHEAEDEFARGRDHADRGRRGDSCNRETLRGSRLASSTVIISSTSRNEMRCILRSAGAPSLNARIIRMSISFTTGTRAAFDFHAGRANLTRTAVDEASEIEARRRHFKFETDADGIAHVTWGASDRSRHAIDRNV